MEKQFVDGMQVYKPNEKAPDFVKANVVVKRDELLGWLKDKGETVRIDIKEGRTGKYYAEVNTYQREAKEQAAPVKDGFKDDDLGDIPF